MMADYLEHKCHTADTMNKKSRDELDDPEKKRQKAIADANKIVSGKWAWKRLEWMVGWGAVLITTGKELTAEC